MVSIISAYPVTEIKNDDGSLAVKHKPGMSLRDYFAGQALAAFEVSVCNDFSSAFYYTPFNVAERCYEIADAMMRKRK